LSAGRSRAGRPPLPLRDALPISLRVRIESVEDPAERAKMVASIEDVTRSLDDILSLARVGRPSDPLERTDLGALLSSVVEEYEEDRKSTRLNSSHVKISYAVLCF